MIHLSLRDSDVDAEVGKNSELEEVKFRKKLGKRHQQYIVMLSLQMQWVLTGVVSRYYLLDLRARANTDQAQRCSIARHYV